jgi:hypothetical protein
MLHLAETMKLSIEARRLLAHLGRPDAHNPLFGADPASAARQVLGVIEPLVRHAGLAPARLFIIRWYAGDVARALAGFHGRDLVLELEAALAKWLRLGCEPNTMQLLLCEVWQTLEPGWQAADSGEAVPARTRTRHPEPPEPGDGKQ